MKVPSRSRRDCAQACTIGTHAVLSVERRDSSLGNCCETCSLNRGKSSKRCYVNSMSPAANVVLRAVGSSKLMSSNCYGEERAKQESKQWGAFKRLARATTGQASTYHVIAALLCELVTEGVRAILHVRSQISEELPRWQPRRAMAVACAI